MKEKKSESRALSSTLQSLRSGISTSSANQFLAIQFHAGNVLSHILFLLLFNNLFLVFIVVASFVLGNRASDKPPCDSQDQDEPEDVDGLQGKKKRKGNDLRNPAFVLLSFPIELVWTNCAEAGQGGPENVQIEVVAEVEPHSDEETKVRASDGRIEVVEALGAL